MNDRFPPPSAHDRFRRSAKNALIQWEELVCPSQRHKRRTYNMENAIDLDEESDGWQLIRDNLIRASNEVIEWAQDEIDTEKIWHERPSVQFNTDGAGRETVCLTASTIHGAIEVNVTFNEKGHAIGCKSQMDWRLSIA